MDGLDADRSRKSSVQQHAVWLFADHAGGLPVLTDLDALSNKTASTLATSLDRVLRSTASVCRRGVDLAKCPADTEVWFVHVLVGDGINTNGAVARMLLADARATPVALVFRYFVMVVRCASHQANLIIGGVVEGHAALCGAHQTADVAGSENALVVRFDIDNPQRAPHRLSCGVLVRLYKYLLNDYHSEFWSSLSAHVATLEFAWEPDGAAVALGAAGDARAADLERLNGQSVVPQGLRALPNGGLDRLLLGCVTVSRCGSQPNEFTLSFDQSLFVLSSVCHRFHDCVTTAVCRTGVMSESTRRAHEPRGWALK